LTKYTELRAEHGESLLIVALKNESVDKLNIGVRHYLKSTGAFQKMTSRSMSASARTTKPSDLQPVITSSSEKKTVGTSQEDQVYNRTRAKILDIQGSGDKATVICQIYAGDKLTDKVIEVSAKSFRDNKLQMEHAYAVTVDAAQGMTVNATVELDEGQGQQRKYVGRTRHRMSATRMPPGRPAPQAAAHMDADRYVNRNTFTPAMARRSSSVSGRAANKRPRPSISSTIVTPRRISCLHNSRFATNATVAKALEDALRLIAQTRFFEGRQAEPVEARTPARAADSSVHSTTGDQTIKVQSSSRADIKAGFSEAKKAWATFRLLTSKSRAARPSGQPSIRSWHP